MRNDRWVLRGRSAGWLALRYIGGSFRPQQTSGVCWCNGVLPLDVRIQGAEDFGVGVAEARDPFAFQLLRDLSKVHTCLRGLHQQRGSPPSADIRDPIDATVIGERVQRRWRQCHHGAGGDQPLDVVDVAVAGGLRGDACPERSLWPRTRRGEPLPPR